MLKYIITLIFTLLPQTLLAHHYKGLPHYSYFENYPQVPTLEFVGVQNGYEIFVTVYNFQGLDINVVQDPDVIRLYAFIYNINTEKIYKGLARFEIHSGEVVKFKNSWEEPEQENIFVLQKALQEQSDLKLITYVKDDSGKEIRIELPFQIKKSFLQKYAVYLCIIGFFLIVALIKILSRRKESSVE